MAWRTARFTSLPGVKVGHATDLRRRTGTTVVLVDPPAIAFADHRGGWPGGYDTQASNLGKTFIDRHAFFLSGGDAYGYDAAIGIRRFLLEKGLAHPSDPARMPGILGTVIYDLDFADVLSADYVDLGYRACLAASPGAVEHGTIGAGTGATVGPFLEDDPRLKGTKGGVGSSAARVGGWTVGAIAVTNCVGNVYDPSAGRTIAGAHRRGSRRFLEMDDLLDAYLRGGKGRAGTTLAIVGTDAPLDHEQLARVVELAQDGIALAVRPAHLSTDGDTVLGFTTGRPRARRLDWRAVDAIHHVAVREVARAIVTSVRAAKTLGGVEGLAGRP